VKILLKADTEIFAHKIIIAAGSSALREYFETHAEVRRPTEKTYSFLQLATLADHDQETGVRLEDVYSTSDALATSVLRHLYGLDIFRDDSDDSSNQDHDSYGLLDTLEILHGYNPDLSIQYYDWVGLCHAADGFGITSLRKKTVQRLEAYLGGLLQVGLSQFAQDTEDYTSMEQFVQVVETIQDSKDGETTAVFEVVAKLCCKHFTALRNHHIFNALTDSCPNFFRAVMDYAAREGMLR
jgi:hypothetical protein